MTYKGYVKNSDLVSEVFRKASYGNLVSDGKKDKGIKGPG